MKTRPSWVSAIAALALAASLVPSPSFARCTKDCKRSINSAYKSCKAACDKGRTGRDCRKACRDDKKTSQRACKSATPPACSPSGAFVFE